MQNAFWAFRSYVDEDCQDVIAGWYRQQPAELQAKFDSRLRFLRQQPREGWVRPYFDLLKGKCSPLGEMRFEFRNVQYRPLGYFSGQMEFTWLIVPTKKDSLFNPKNACEIAKRRMKEIARSAERSHVYQF